MKKSEKNAVKNAFGIPEPKHKEEFIAEYTSRLENRRCSPVPVFFKYAAAAAFAVIMISICIVKLPSPDKEFTGSDVITEVTTSGAANEHTTLSDGSAVTTQPASDNSASTETSSVTTDDTVSDVTTSETASTAASTGSAETEKTVTTAKTTATTTDKTTSPQKTTTAKTNTTKTTTTASTTSAAEDTVPTQTATTPGPLVTETSVQTSTPPTMADGGNDYTVKPSVIYYYPEDYPVEDGDDTGAVRPGDPVDSDTPTTPLPGGSSNTIVRGRVLQVYFTSINDQPFIQVDIEISDVLRSWYLNTNDRITIYIPGGCIPDGHGGYIKARTEFIPDTGRDYLFMLNSAYYPFPDKTFLLSESAEMSVFTQNGYYYVSAVNSSIAFSVQDVESNIR